MQSSSVVNTQTQHYNGMNGHTQLNNQTPSSNGQLKNCNQIKENLINRRESHFYQSANTYDYYQKQLIKASTNQLNQQQIAENGSSNNTDAFNAQSNNPNFRPASAMAFMDFSSSKNSNNLYTKTIIKNNSKGQLQNGVASPPTANSYQPRIIQPHSYQHQLINNHGSAEQQNNFSLPKPAQV